MVEHYNFNREDVFPSWFADRIQDFLSAARTDLRISLKNSTTVQVVPSTELGIAAIALEGRWRFNTGTVERAHPGGAAGTYVVWAVALDNVVNDTPVPHTDHTTYTFELRITSGADPSGSGVEVFEKIAEVEWDGAKITATRQTHGSVSGAMIEPFALSNEGDIAWSREPSGAWVPQLKANVVGASELADASVDTAALINLAVTTAKVAAQAITNEKLGLSAVGVENINNLAVSAAKLAAEAVIAEKIGSEAVTTAKIQNLAITAAKLAALAVGTGQLANLAVTAGKIAEEAVGTTKLAPLSVTAVKIAEGVVEESKLTDGAATSRKMKPTIQEVLQSGEATWPTPVPQTYGNVPGIKMEFTPPVNSNLIVDFSAMLVNGSGASLMFMNVFANGEPVISEGFEPFLTNTTVATLMHMTVVIPIGAGEKMVVEGKVRHEATQGHVNRRGTNMVARLYAR